MSKIQSIWLFVRRHKYSVVTLIFVALIGFVGDSSVWQRILNIRRMNHLENEIQRYADEYESDTRKLDALRANPANMERIARERYLMKKSNEDIFVFEEDLPKSSIPMEASEDTPEKSETKK